MGTKVKAVVLGGLVATAAFCAYVCLLFPAVCLVAVYDLAREYRGWSRELITVWAVTLFLSLLVALRTGWKVARDWQQNGRDAIRTAE